MFFISIGLFMGLFLLLNGLLPGAHSLVVCANEWEYRPLMETNSYPRYKSVSEFYIFV